jgi:hypothetical protein
VVWTPTPMCTSQRRLMRLAGCWGSSRSRRRCWLRSLGRVVCVVVAGAVSLRARVGQDSRRWIHRLGSTGAAVEAGEDAVEPSQLVARPQPDLRVEIDDAVSAMSTSDTVIVGGLSQPSHTGTIRLFPRLPSGHIPGAVNIPALDNLDPETGRLPPVAELVECWDPIVDSVERVTTYCGAGMYGAFNLFVLYPPGYDAALCDGSWEEWAATKHLPVATTTAGSKDDRCLSGFAQTTVNGGTSAQMPGIVRAFSLVLWTARCSTSSSAPLSSVDPLEADRTESWFGDVALPGSPSWASA